MISMSAFGQIGPFRGFIGYGPPAAAPLRSVFREGYSGGDPLRDRYFFPIRMQVCRGTGNNGSADSSGGHWRRASISTNRSGNGVG